MNQATAATPIRSSSTASSPVGHGAGAAAAGRVSAGIASIFSHAWQVDLAGLTLCAVLTAGAYFVGWQPRENGRAAAEARQSALKLAREQVASLSVAARSARTQLTNVQAAVAKIGVPLQPASGVNQRMAELTALAGDCGLDVQYTQTGAVSSNPRYAQLPIQLSGAGTYRTCAIFLHALRQRFADIGVKSFDIAAAPSESSTVSSFNFQLTWYVQPTSR